MNKQKVRKFKNHQNRLGKTIAEAHGCTNFTIKYEQYIPDAYTDWKTRKLIIANNSQYIFTEAVPHKGKKHRLIVIMHFQGVCSSRTVGKIVRRHFWIRDSEDGFEIITSFNPHTISNLKF